MDWNKVKLISIPPNDNTNKSDCHFNSEQIYIIPTNDKPVKIIYEDLPCPIDSNTRCKNAEMVVENDVIMIKCNHQDRDICIFDTRNLIDSVRSF